MKVRSAILGAALLLMCDAEVRATAQEADIIIIDGQSFSLFSNPLAQYLEDSKVSSKVFEAGRYTTGNWRGYVATWEIRGAFLWLIRLDRPHGLAGGRDPEQIPIDEIFPGQKLPIAASWFSGTLIIPHGEMVQYVHMGYGSKFDHEFQIWIWNGRASDPEVIDYTGPDNSRCLADYLRCPEVDSIVDTGDWIDGRLLGFNGMVDDGAAYTTRGFLELHGDTAEISVPATRQSKRVNIYFGTNCSFASFRSGTFVEVSLSEFADTVFNMRPLMTNESIHSKRYRQILDSLRAHR